MFTGDLLKAFDKVREAIGYQTLLGIYDRPLSGPEVRSGYLAVREARKRQSHNKGDIFQVGLPSCSFDDDYKERFKEVDSWVEVMLTEDRLYIELRIPAHKGIDISITRSRHITISTHLPEWLVGPLRLSKDKSTFKGEDAFWGETVLNCESKVGKIIWIKLMSFYWSCLMNSKGIRRPEVLVYKKIILTLTKLCGYEEDIQNALRLICDRTDWPSGTNKKKKAYRKRLQPFIG